MFDIERILNEESQEFDSLDTILTEANIVRMDKQTLRTRRTS